MSEFYTWSVQKLECSEQQPEVVQVVHWRVSMTDASNAISFYGTERLAYDPNASFIAFQDLTHGQILYWVHASMGAEKVQALESELEKQTNSLPTQLSLPWAAE